MTKKNIDNVKVLKKIVKKKEREDKDNSRYPLPGITINDFGVIASLCRRHNE